MDGLIFGILRYYSERFLFSRGQKMSKDFLSYIVGQIIVSNLIKCVKNEGINNARLHETRKKNMKCNIVTKAYRSRCSSETHQVRPESIKTFRPSYPPSKSK